MRKKFWALFSILAALILLSLLVGRYRLPLSEIPGILLGGSENELHRNLLLNIRLPRTILAVLCGGALSLSGLVLQNIFQNPLASPDILGADRGCSIGAVAAIVFTAGGAAETQLLTFGAGIIAVLFSLGLARALRGNRVLSLVLAGIVSGALASSAIMAMKYLADPERQLAAIEYWLMGSFSGSSFRDVWAVLPVILPAALLLYLLRWRLKLLTLGDDEARSLGVRTGLLRIAAILCATLLVSAVVSVAGVVSWTGLVAPHIVRALAGDDLVKTFSLSFLCGGILLLFSDILSRTLFSAELPISILTSLLGAFFLFFLLRRRRRRA